MRDTKTGVLTSATSRIVVVALLTLVAVALQPREARACSCAPVTTAEMVERATFVFAGQETGRLATNNPWPSVAVTFEVIEAYKGEVGTEITVWTGGGEADCGVSPQRGLVGIAAYVDGDRAFIDICGSVHSPDAIAAVIDPIDIVAGAAPHQESDDGGVSLPWIGGVAAAVVIGGIYVATRRRNDYQDGWGSGA